MLCLTQDMPARGSSEQGALMLVGPAPTSADDIAGEYMSGRVGKVLDDALRDAGITDSWRLVPAIRQMGDVTTADIDASRPGLIAEVQQYRPSAIVALGDIALRMLCKRAGLSALRGTSVPLHPEFGYDCEVYPVYSPSAILAVPKMRNTLITDLRRVQGRIKPDEPINYIRTQTDAWTAEGPTAVDVETDFFVTGGEKVVQWAAWGPARVATVSQTVPRVVSGTPLITHNGWAFDVPVLRRNGTAVPDLGDDTMVLAYLVDESQPRGLEALAVKYLGVKGWKEGLHAEIGSEEFAAYNARDVEYTYRLWELFCEILGPRKRIHDHVMRPSFRALQACAERGLYINQRVAALWEEKYAKEQAALREEITQKTGIGNPNSPAQVSTYLFGDAKKSSNAASLLGNANPVAGRILQYRHAGKMLSTFIRPYKALGRIHFQSNILGTDTGRISARYHNMPRELKEMFGAPDGKCFASVDYAAIEFRFAVWHAGVSSVLERYRQDADGFDPHKWFAGHFYGVPSEQVTKGQRQIAKSGNFGLLYRSSAEGLAQYAFKTSGVHMELGTAVAVRNKWLQLMPEVPAWWDSVERFVRKHGYIESVTGRRRHFGDPSLLPRGGGQWNDIVRAAINHTVQSPCTDIAQIGLAACHQAGYPINGFFHDAITFEWDSEEEARAREPDVRRILTEEPIRQLRDIFGVDITVPLSVEFTYTKGEGVEASSI